MCGIGTAFHFRAVGSHLWMVITHPAQDGSFLIVAMTTLDEGVDDESCVLEEGEHHCISHKSVIYYKDARVWNLEGFEAALENNLIVLRQPLEAHILLRVQSGALKSDYFKRKFHALVAASM